MDQKTVKRAAETLKMASDATRAETLLLLGEQPRNVTELTEALGLKSQPAVSHHLMILRYGKLIEYRRDGKQNVYSLTTAGEAMAALVRKMAAS